MASGCSITPLYIGQLIWGRTRWVRDPKTKKKRRFLADESTWIRSSVESLRIIDEPLWQRVKQRQQTIHRASETIRSVLHANARTGRGPKHLFSRLLACAQCGRKYVVLDPNAMAVADGSIAA